MNTAFMVSGFRNGLDPYYLLGLFNSNVFKFYWSQKFSDGRKQFPKIKGTYLEQMPVIINSKYEKPIIETVKLILNCETDQREGLMTDLNSIVYDAYGIIPDHRNVIEECIIQFEKE